MDNPNILFDDDRYTIGATISVPLDYNANSALQEAKAAYLRKKLEIEDKKLEETSLYDKGVSKIKNYEEYIKVTRENIRLYTKLISIIEKAFKAGVKTGYDLQTLRNTKKIDELEIEANEINIQIELARLLFATDKAKDYYE